MVDDSPPCVHILGGGSVAAPALVSRLAAAGERAEIFSRSAPSFTAALPEGIGWHARDVVADTAWRPPAGAVVVSLLPLPVTAALVPRLAGIRQLVALGSMAIVAWAGSTDPGERTVVADLSKAEQTIGDAGRRDRFAWTILRPTMIYGAGRDNNVAAIVRFVRRFRAFPVAAPGRGRRQPLHTDDLADAIIACIGNAAADSRVLDLPGGETIDYRSLIRRACAADGLHPIILPVPAMLLRLALATANRLSGSGYSPALFARMNDDQVYDGQPAADVLNVRPGPYRPGPNAAP